MFLKYWSGGVGGGHINCFSFSVYSCKVGKKVVAVLACPARPAEFQEQCNFECPQGLWYRASSMEENTESVANAGVGGGKPVVLSSSCSLVSLKVPSWRDNVAAIVKGFSFPGGTIRLFLQVLLLPLQQQQKSKRLRWWHSHLLGRGSIPCGVLLFLWYAALGCSMIKAHNWVYIMGHTQFFLLFALFITFSVIVCSKK